MNVRGSPIFAVFSVLVFLGWLAYAGVRTTEGEPRPTASRSLEPGEAADPGFKAAPDDSRCAVPVRWRIGSVDPRFGISADELERAVRTAVDVWESSVTGSLFVQDPEHGLPIQLRYDERQARTAAVLEADQRLRAAWSALEAERERLDAAWDSLERLSYETDALARELAVRLDRHNDAVGEWNAAGGAPDSIAARLGEQGRSLGREQARISERGEAEMARDEALREAESKYADRVWAVRREADRMEKELPPTAVSSGSYVRTLYTDPSGRSSVRSEIVVFRFADRAELVRILAHELGHALGLGHTDQPGSVMYAQQDRLRHATGTLTLHRADRTLLRAHCATPPTRAGGVTAGTSDR